MPTITAAGIGSNLDVDAIVGQLMAVERQPLAALARKEASYQAQLSAYGVLRGALAGFRDAASALAQPATFAGWRATPGDATLFGATASAGASAGSHAVEVKALAQAQRLTTAAFAATSDALGSGTLTIEFGTYAAGTFTANADKPAKTVTIPAGSQSLAGVRDAINAARAGVAASIVNDGTGHRLVLASADTGAANALRITVDDADGNDTDAAGLSALAYDAATGGTANLAETVAARDAEVVIDGITVTRASNVVAGALEGVTLTLAKAAPGSTATLAVSRDATAGRTAVGNLVDAYNDLAATLRDLGGYDAAARRGGVLQGDAAVRTLQAQLRAALGASLDTAGGGLATLADAGIRFDRSGRLELDAAKLAATFDDPAKDVASLFAAIGKPTDSLVAFVGATAQAREGRLALAVTQLATRGVATGSAPAATVITAGVDDGLSVQVDGIGASITIPPGTYTAAALAASLQSRINGALGTDGPRVTVTQTAGVLAIHSDRYGSASQVKVLGGSGAAALLGTATSVDGLDAAGRIGGQAATGSGQTLTAGGLTVRVEGGATGDRGRIDFARGFGERLAALADGFLDDAGALAGRTDGIGRSIADLDVRRSTLERRLTDVEARYRAQFAALDAMMSRMNQTSTFLAQQLASLPTADRE